MPPAEERIQNKLLGFYGKKFPSRENTQISSLTMITSGWENELYSFRISYEEAAERKCEDLILRIYPGDDAVEKSAREFYVMKQLHEFGFPVPKVFLFESDSSPFGKPFVVMEKIDGRLLSLVFLESPDKMGQELMTLFCKIFVDLHALDWRPFANFILTDPSIYDIKDPYAFINHKLSNMRRAIDDFQKDEFVPILDWLEARSSDVPCERLSLVHRDYHPENILLRSDGAAFVIDWGAVDIADFRSDMAWTLLLASTYVNPGMRQIILGEYERIVEYKIEQMEYFEVMAIFRRLFDISVSLSEGANKMGMRPGAVRMMKQDVDHIRRVYALLRDRTGITIPEMEVLLSNLT